MFFEMLMLGQSLTDQGRRGDDDDGGVLGGALVNGSEAESSGRDFPYATTSSPISEVAVAPMASHEEILPV